jgi:hypothetical protein
VTFSGGFQDNRAADGETPASGWELRWSVDGFSSALIEVLNTSVDSQVLNVAPAVTSVTSDQPVELRFFPKGASNSYITASLGRYLGGVGIQVNGRAAAVPEPAGLGLLLAGLPVLARRRR